MKSLSNTTSLVSIIIPVYNQEHYIADCLNSVLKQSYSNIEVLVVDDGSVDSSLDMLQRYAEKDTRLHVLTQTNGGVTKARQLGLKHATGEYIAFVDSDDWIDEDFIELLVKDIHAQDADMVATGCILEKAAGSEIDCNRIRAGVYENEFLEREIYPRMFCFEGFFHFGIQPYLWNKLFKKELILEHFQKIDTRIYNGEDVAILFPYILNCKKIVVTEDAKYHYRIHGQSVTANKKLDFYENVSRLYLYLNEQFKATEYYDVMLPQLDQYMRMMVRSGNLDSFIEAERKIFPFDKIEQNANVILYGAGHIGKLFYYQLKQTKYCQLIAWLDRNKHGNTDYGFDIEMPDAIQQKEFDYVVIALEDDNVIEKVRCYLMEMNVDSNKIIF